MLRIEPRFLGGSSSSLHPILNKLLADKRLKKIRFVLEQAMKAQRERRRIGSSTLSLTSPLDRGGC
jgi:hypothetical protein